MLLQITFGKLVLIIYRITLSRCLRSDNNNYVGKIFQDKDFILYLFFFYQRYHQLSFLATHAVQILQLLY